MADVEKTVVIKVDDSQVKAAQASLVELGKQLADIYQTQIQVPPAPPPVPVAPPPKPGADPESRSDPKAREDKREEARKEDKKDEKEAVTAQLNKRNAIRRALTSGGMTGAVATGTVVGGVLLGLGKEMVAAVQGQVEMAASIQAASAKFGASVPEINKYRYALGLSAEDAGLVAERMKRFQRTDEDIAEMATQMEGAKNSAHRMAMATRLLGADVAEKLAPALNQGGDSIHRALTEFTALGGGMDKEAIGSFRSIELSFKRMQLASEGLVGELAKGIAPILTYITDKIARGHKVMRDFMKDLDMTRVTLVALGVAIVGAGTAMAAGLLPVFLQTLAVFGPWVLGLTAAFLILEDLVGWAKGDASLFGKVLNDTFGPGSSQALREFFNALVKGAQDAIEPLLTLQDLAHDLKNVWETAKDVVDYGVSSAMGDGSEIDDIVRKQRLERIQKKIYHRLNGPGTDSNNQNLGAMPADYNANPSSAAGFMPNIFMGMGMNAMAAPSPVVQVVQTPATNHIYTNVSEDKIRKIVAEQGATKTRQGASLVPGGAPFAF